MFVNVAEESFRKISQASSEQGVNLALAELNALREYVNTSAREISKRYSLTVTVIEKPSRYPRRRRNQSEWQESRIKA